MACCKIKLIGTLIIGWVRFFFFWLCLLCLLLLLEFVNDICYILSWPLCFNNLLNIISVGFFCFLLNFRLLLGLRWGRRLLAFLFHNSKPLFLVFFNRMSIASILLRLKWFPISPMMLDYLIDMAMIFFTNVTNIS